MIPQMDPDISSVMTVCLIEHNNIEKFASELSHLIRDEEKREKLSENAFKNRHRFSAKEVIKKWNDLI